MPKEVIRGDVLSDDAAVSVGWMTDCEVQVGVGIGKRVILAEDVSAASDETVVVPHYSDLWFTFKTRRQINDLIRNLRRARDAAFGADA